MGNISKIDSAERQIVTIEVPIHWLDHHNQGRAVLPAVAAMQLMAQWVLTRFPQTDIRAMRRARFEKFLPLPLTGPVSAVSEMTPIGTAAIQGELATKVTAKTTKMSRLMVHARAEFGAAESIPDRSVGAGDPDGDMTAADLLVDPARIYAELVPFGPAFQNIVEPLHLCPHGAMAQIIAPDLSDPQTQQPLGSPFVADAAFHAACVWSQRYAGIVAFPVGIETRVIHTLTVPGQRYTARVVPVKQDGAELVFDLWIRDEAGRPAETLKGVTMRDVSGGRLVPPDWIMAEDTGS